MTLPRSLLCAALLLPLLAPAPAPAATPTLAVVFVAVDRYLITPNRRVEVTGLVEGESTPRTVYFYGGEPDSAPGLSSPAIRCEKLALLAMASPGKFKLELAGLITSTDPYSYPSCALTRVKP
jgi:hypothetical protein